MTLNAKIGGFMDFLAISGCDTSLHHSEGGATTELSLCDPLIQIENMVFVYQLSMNQNCYRLSCILWALAHISCLTWRSCEIGSAEDISARLRLSYCDFFVWSMSQN